MCRISAVVAHRVHLGEVQRDRLARRGDAPEASLLRAGDRSLGDDEAVGDPRALDRELRVGERLRELGVELGERLAVDGLAPEEVERRVGLVALERGDRLRVALGVRVVQLLDPTRIDLRLVRVVVVLACVGRGGGRVADVRLGALEGERQHGRRVLRALHLREQAERVGVLAQARDAAVLVVRRDREAALAEVLLRRLEALVVAGHRPGHDVLDGLHAALLEGPNVPDLEVRELPERAREAGRDVLPFMRLAHAREGDRRVIREEGGEFLPVVLVERVAHVRVRPRDELRERRLLDDRWRRGRRRLRDGRPDQGHRRLSVAEARGGAERGRKDDEREEPEGRPCERERRVLHDKF